jgi:hypothetical protein
MAKEGYNTREVVPLNSPQKPERLLVKKRPVRYEANPAVLQNCHMEHHDFSCLLTLNR